MKREGRSEGAILQQSRNAHLIFLLTIMGLLHQEPGLKTRSNVGSTCNSNLAYDCTALSTAEEMLIIFRIEIPKLMNKDTVESR